MLGEAVEDVFGWDNKFWRTLRMMFVNPREVVVNYLNGQRGRYMNPFSLYGFLLTISVLIYTIFSVQVLELMNGLQTSSSPIDQSGWNEQVMNYQGILSFLFLPIYTLMAYFVFRKPYNFGEHFIISVYTFSLISVFGLLSTLIGIITGNTMLYFSMSYITMFVSYIYVYQSIYKASIGKWVIYILKFILVLFLIMLIPLLIGIAMSIYYATQG